MPNKLLELLQKRAKLIADARALAEGENVDAEKNAQIQTMLREAQELKDRAEQMQQIQAAETEEVLHDHRASIAGSPAAGELEQQALAVYARGGDEAISGASEDVRTAFEGLQDRALDRYVRGGLQAMSLEMRAALNVTDLTRGGALRPPERIVQQIITAIDDEVFIRPLATVIPVDEGQSAGAVSLDTDPADFDWTTEIPAADLAEDDATKFGSRELTPTRLAKLIKISKTLAGLPSYDVVGFVIRRLAYKLGITYEKGYLLGTGVKQPLGLFVASAMGIPTTRDVSLGNTATAIKMDGLLNARGALKAGYRRNARWLFHRDAMTQISLLRDDHAGAGTGGYLWQPSVQMGQPDMLLGRPVLESEFVPNTFTASNYVGMFADFSNYWIADSTQMTIQRLVELFALKNTDGILATAASDGMPVLAEAFVRVKLTA